MSRVLEKKEYPKFVSKCWNVANDLHKCFAKSRSFNNLDHDTQNVIFRATGKRFLFEYFNMFANENNEPSTAASLVYNTDSIFWDKNRETLEELNSECNLFGLVDCCKDTYNLEAMKGNYEFANRFLQKK